MPAGSPLLSLPWQAAATMLQRALPSPLSETRLQSEQGPELQFKPCALVVDDSADIAFMLVTLMNMLVTTPLWRSPQLRHLRQQDENISTW
jgi:hypothetical protein